MYIGKDKNERKSETSKFYILDANEIYFIDDDDSLITLDSFFEKNNIPEKFQKVFIQICGVSKCKEFITDLIFDIAKLTEINNFNNKSIRGNSNLEKVMAEDRYGYSDYEGIVFETKNIKKFKYDVLLTFLNEMKSENLLRNYIESITTFMSNGINFSKNRRIMNTLNDNYIDSEVSCNRVFFHNKTKQIAK